LLKIISYVWLYLGWFACVLLAKNNLAAYSLFIPLIGWLLFFKAFLPAWQVCFKLFFLSALGMLADTVALKLNIIHFSADPVTNFLPIWMISLWLLFVPSIYLLKKLFSRRLWLAAVVGAIAGPISYKSGKSFGVLSLQGAEGILIYAIFWSLYLPLAINWVNTPDDPPSARR